MRNETYLSFLILTLTTDFSKIKANFWAKNENFSEKSCKKISKSLNIGVEYAKMSRFELKFLKNDLKIDKISTEKFKKQLKLRNTLLEILK